jgi:hypothetical protein
MPQEFWSGIPAKISRREATLNFKKARGDFVLPGNYLGEAAITHSMAALSARIHSRENGQI